MNTQKMPLKNSLCLLLAATIWGIAFVAQSVGGYIFSIQNPRSLDRRYRLRHSTFCSQQLPAVRHQIYNGRKSRLHHSLLYCHCPDYRILSEKEMQSLYLGSRCHGTDRTLSSLHHGRFFHWSRRRPGAGVCVPVFSAHSGH